MNKMYKPMDKRPWPPTPKLKRSWAHLEQKRKKMQGVRIIECCAGIVVSCGRRTYTHEKAIYYSQYRQLNLKQSESIFMHSNTLLTFERIGTKSETSHLLAADSSEAYPV